MNWPYLRATTVTIIAGLTLAGPVYAEQLKANPKAVVELFTSQGCAQCPPADDLLGKLGERADVLTLAYHVDYWDFMGWSDQFGQRAFSDRQRAYAKRWGASRIFTPQMVINGVQGVIGSRTQEVETAVGAAQLSFPIEIETTETDLVVSISPAAGEAEASVWAVSYLPTATTKIDAGENQGRSFDYTNVVTEREYLGVWQPDSGARYTLPLSALQESDTGLVILVQDERNGLPGEILAAASYQP